MEVPSLKDCTAIVGSSTGSDIENALASLSSAARGKLADALEISDAAKKFEALLTSVGDSTSADLEAALSDLAADTRRKLDEALRSFTPNASVRDSATECVEVEFVVDRDLSEPSDEIVYLLATVRPPSDETAKRQPSDVVCVVDISGSMGAEAKIQGSGGTSESNGLSLLDVAKHGVRTIIKTLGEQDRLAIVSFNHESSVVVPLTRMDTEGQAQAEQALDTLGPMGGTNIWAGIKSALDELSENPMLGSFGHVMLLTDGESNNREQIKPNLEQYIKTHERLPGTINTFGFGYNLDSVLLVDLAETGSGSYSFIPDAGFVGTAFVNTISNLLVTMAREVYLTLSVEDGNAATIDKVMGGYPSEAIGDSIRVNLGTLQYGQTKDIIFPVKVGTFSECFLTGQVQYETSLAGKKDESPCAYADGELIDRERVAIHYSRCLFADTLQKALAVARTSSCEEARGILEAAIVTVSDISAKDNDIIIKLLEDMNGQSTEALCKQEWFMKWGRHYLPSLMFAHRLQQCNNFKDPGVQVYGGELCKTLQDAADDLFNKLPPPKPSIRRPSVVAPTSMARFNDRYAG